MRLRKLYPVIQEGKRIPRVGNASNKPLIGTCRSEIDPYCTNGGPTRQHHRICWKHFSRTIVVAFFGKFLSGFLEKDSVRPGDIRWREQFYISFVPVTI